MFFLKSLQEWPVRKDFVFKNQFHKICYNKAFFSCNKSTDRIKNKLSLAEINDKKKKSYYILYKYIHI